MLVVGLLLSKATSFVRRPAMAHRLVSLVVTSIRLENTSSVLQSLTASATTLCCASAQRIPW